MASVTLPLINKRLILVKNPQVTQTPWWVSVLSVVLAFVFCGVLIAFSGNDPLVVFARMFKGAFGSTYGLSETLLKAIPLLLCGLGVAIAYKIAIWNIGAEGQLVMGAIAATSVTIFWPDMAMLPSLCLMVLLGFIAGGIWGLFTAIPRVYFQVNEIITSLMLNYVALLLLDYLVFDPWKDPNGFNFPGTAIFNSAQQLPNFGDTRLHVGLFIALIAVAVYAVFVKKTTWGYRIRLLAANPNAARYAGMNVSKQILIVMLLSGGLAGLAGMAEVSGVTHRLMYGISPGYGYTAIIVAWLAKLNPWGLLISSVLCGAVIVGGYSVQLIGLPVSMAMMIQGAILFFLIGGEALGRYRFSWQRIGKGAAQWT